MLILSQLTLIFYNLVFLGIDVEASLMLRNVVRDPVLGLRVPDNYQCLSCLREGDIQVRGSICWIQFADSSATSVGVELERSTSGLNHEAMDKHCDGCGGQSVHQKRTFLSSSFRYLYIGLKIFRYDNRIREERKITPNILIEENLDNLGLGRFTLKGVVYHHGSTAHSGHYTSAVRYGSSWYTMDDSRKSVGVSLNCRSTDRMTPYLIVYEKNSESFGGVQNAVNRETQFDARSGSGMHNSVVCGGKKRLSDNDGKTTNISKIPRTAAERKRDSRAKCTAAKREIVRQKDREARADRRKNLTAEEREEARERHRKEEADRRENLTEGEREEARKRDSEAKA